MASLIFSLITSIVRPCENMEKLSECAAKPPSISSSNIKMTSFILLLLHRDSVKFYQNQCISAMRNFNVSGQFVSQFYSGTHNFPLSIICSTRQPLLCNSREIHFRWHFHGNRSAQTITQSRLQAIDSRRPIPRMNSSVTR